MTIKDSRLLLCCFLSAALFAWTLRLASEWEEKLAVYPAGIDLTYDQSSEDEEEEEDEGEEEAREQVVRKKTETGTSQKVWKAGGMFNAQYHFVNFNRDKLDVSFSMPAEYYRKYLTGYGYTDEEYSALKKWRETAYRAAWEAGYERGGKPAAEKAVKEVGVEYETRLRGMFYKRGLALRTGNIVECDMPGIVRRNAPELKSLALAFQAHAKKNGYGSEDTVGAVVSMVQTAIRYKIPPTLEGTRHTGGLLPPARSLLSGWGDCDTKTGVVASILANWSGIKMVGIAVPRHYLMAIRRIPGKGDMFVRYEGLEYVLIEPAGPAWLEPGSVGKYTAELLKSSKGYVIEPFF
ncbi:MAG: hypothetical protein COT17_05575 [Elusimicrobia bacterium CG08_land_8_20_14_0_20_51_18]|nr:MAG: hypothetical protein COT17_05575 [Elusimicrobia bacterium CG08_land_8_20_14_0_20_51_18]